MLSVGYNKTENVYDQSSFIMLRGGHDNTKNSGHNDVIDLTGDDKDVIDLTGDVDVIDLTGDDNDVTDLTGDINQLPSDAADAVVEVINLLDDVEDDYRTQQTRRRRVDESRGDADVVHDVQDSDPDEPKRVISVADVVHDVQDSNPEEPKRRRRRRVADDDVMIVEKPRRRRRVAVDDNINVDEPPKRRRRVRVAVDDDVMVVENPVRVATPRRRRRSVLYV